MSPTTSPSWNARSAPVSVTSPIAVHGSSQRAHTSRTESSISGRTTATIRSCDSEIMISHGSMPSSRNGTRSRWTSIPASPEAISESAEARPGGAAVLQRLDVAGPDELERDLDELLAGERVADLDGRALVGVVLAQLRAREHRRAADAVAAGRRAVEDDEPPGPARLRRAQPVGLEQPDAHRVDEAVRGVGGVEDGLPADGRHADAVAVVADSRRRPAGTGSRARRTRARRAARSAARPSRSRRGGSRRSRSPLPGTARPPTGGCATRP